MVSAGARAGVRVGAYAGGGGRAGRLIDARERERESRIAPSRCRDALSRRVSVCRRWNCAEDSVGRRKNYIYRRDGYIEDERAGRCDRWMTMHRGLSLPLSLSPAAWRGSAHRGDLPARARPSMAVISRSLRASFPASSLRPHSPRPPTSSSDLCDTADPLPLWRDRAMGVRWVLSGCEARAIL
jgi:hypothetical protein